MTPLLTLDRLTRRFGGTAAVDDVSLDVASGEFFSLLGPSGCGKTTLLRLIAGFERPDAGTIRMLGETVTDRRPYQRPVGLVFQSYALFPHLTVEENVAFGLVERGIAVPERRRRAAEGLALVQLDPDTFAARRPAQLSGGQRQRVALARALVLEPPLLLLDEPLAALDLQLRRAMQVELRELNRRLGTTFLLVTHDQDEALAMSDRVAVMRAGRIEQIDTPAVLYDRPRTAFVARFIGEANVLGDIAVRPERVAVLSPDAPRDDRPALEGTVRETLFRGDARQIAVETAAGEVQALARDGSTWHPGDRVRVTWSAADERPLAP